MTFNFPLYYFFLAYLTLIIILYMNLRYNNEVNRNKKFKDKDK